jgi:hypothetical protein
LTQTGGGGETKVYEEQVSSSSLEENILKLQVAVDYPRLMHLLEGH